MVDLKQLKVEVHSLPNLNQHFVHFHDNWFKPVRAPLVNNSSNLNRLSRIDQRIRSELFHRIQKIEEVMPNLKGSQVINEKLQGYSRLLIEFKLAIYSGNGLKAKTITSQLLKDDYMKLDATIKEIKLFEESLNTTISNYSVINQILRNNLPLEEKLMLTESSHNHHLKTMIKVNEKQKYLMTELGKQFIAINHQMNRNLNKR